MQRERVTEDIYVFTSELYAQVTAGVVLTSEGAVLIDTLAYPDETKQIKRFIEERLAAKVRYVVNTHFHADHTMGTYFFPDAQIVSHRLCRKLLDERGTESIEHARSTLVEMQDLTVILPDLVFNDSLTLHLGDKTFQLWSTPGHSPDSIVCLVREDQVLFAADTIMPVPYFVDGGYDEFLNTLHILQQHNFEHVIQGHGEIVLRGEIPEKIQGDIDYLVKLREKVTAALQSRNPEKALDSITIESCGKSRILLNGLVQQLHRQNVQWLADRLRQILPIQYQNGS